jgi:GntR family transcriptional regulator, transcriptional repressor for pyruvate dehydrogenase complex
VTVTTRSPRSDAGLPAFEPIVRRTVSEEVRDRLLRSIETGELDPGAQLPSERTLCDEFAVARTSVREAIQGLVSIGVVERRGNRTYVVEHLPALDLSSTDFRKDRVRELFEVRRLIELPMAELAAIRARPDQRTEMAVLARGFIEDMPLPEFRALDRLFHSSLARCCGNALLVELYGKVLDALFESDAFESLLYSSKNQPQVDQLVADSCADHRAIAEAIAAGDAVGTVRAVEHHLQAVEDRMVRGLE